MTNSLMNCRWQVEAERLKSFAVENRLTGQTLGLEPFAVIVLEVDLS